MANNTTKTHPDSVLTRLADAAITTRHLLVKEGSDDNHIAITALASDEPKGVCLDEPEAAEDAAAVRVLGSGPGTVKMVGSAAIDESARVYTSTNGRVSGTPTVAGTYWWVGKALSDCSGAGVEFEVEPCLPIKVVVIAAPTSTNGTAAGAADLAALKAEAEKIGDDVRAIYAALDTPALLLALA